MGSWLFDWGDDRVMAFEREHGREHQQMLGDFFKGDLTQGVEDFSSVVWHPSAGLDWSPLVFYSPGYLSRKESYQDLTAATFHVMTNLWGYDEDLLEILESRERVCYEDDRTLVRVAEYDLD